MPVTLEWENAEKTIVRFTFEGKWALDELYPVLEEQTRLLSSVDHTVHAIVDVRNSPILPQNILSIRSRQDRHAADNQGISVVVGGGRFVATIAKMYQQFANHEVSIHFAKTLEEALQIIEAELSRSS